jgi:hypothetical protein
MQPDTANTIARLGSVLAFWRVAYMNVRDAFRDITSILKTM